MAPVASAATPVHCLARALQAHTPLRSSTTLPAFSLVWSLVPFVNIRASLLQSLGLVVHSTLSVSMSAQLPRLCFICDWLDPSSGVLWKYQLFYYPETKEVEVRVQALEEHVGT